MEIRSRIPDWKSLQSAQMAKRIFAGAVGIGALVACFFASVYAIGAVQDAHFSDFACYTLVGHRRRTRDVFDGSGTLVIGFKFLDYALTGRSRGVGGRWLRPLLLGCGLFFPVFVASLAAGSTGLTASLTGIKIKTHLSLCASVFSSAWRERSSAVGCCCEKHAFGNDQGGIHNEGEKSLFHF